MTGKAQRADQPVDPLQTVTQGKPPLVRPFEYRAYHPARKAQP